MDSTNLNYSLKQLFWDNSISEDILQKILNNEIEEFQGITRQKIYVRLLESFQWYQILSLIKKNQIEEILSDEVITKIWNNPLRQRYEYARRFLL